MPRPKQRTPELRDRVLQTAVAMLAEGGPAAFTTRAVATGAQTSVPAVYELFGDKAGLVREIFFEGFRQLRARFERLHDTDDPRADLLSVVGAYRSFVRANPALAQVMFGRPFADFDPSAADLDEGAAVRMFIVRRVRRCIDAGVIAGSELDISHVLLALAQGLMAREAAGLLGNSRASVNRRWTLAFDAALTGLKPEA
jgi:AcrR family transcriptional regulator